MCLDSANAGIDVCENIGWIDEILNVRMDQFEHGNQPSGIEVF